MAYKTSEYFEQHCSSLKHLWTQYLEHDAVMVSNFAGPQGDSKKSVRAREHFGFEVDDARIKNSDQVFFTCYADKVEVNHCFDGCREEHEMTHENCLKYLAQLPRPWYSFATSVSYPEANEND